MTPVDEINELAARFLRLQTIIPAFSTPYTVLRYPSENFRILVLSCALCQPFYLFMFLLLDGGGAFERSTASLLVKDLN